MVSKLKSRKYVFGELDSEDEIIEAVNRLEINLANEVSALNDEIERLNDKITKKRSQKSARKKGFVMKNVLMSIAVLGIVCGLIITVASGAYVRSDINYVIASNPDELERYLRDVLGTNTGWNFAPQTTKPSGTNNIDEGDVVYDTVANALFVSTDGSTWTQLAAASGNSLDGAYDLGVKINVDGDVLELEVADGSNNSAFHIDHDESTNDNTAFLLENAADAADAISIDIDAQSTGRDIEGTGAAWYVTGAGGLTAVLGTFSGDVQVTGSSYNINFDVSRDQLSFADNANLGIGGADNAAADFVFSYDGTDFNLEAAAANDDFKMGETTHFDLSIMGATNTNLVKFDTDDSALLCIFDGFDLRMNDDDFIIFGDSVASDSFTAKFDETTDNLQIVATTASDAVQFGDGTTVTDVLFVSSGGSVTTGRVHFDGSQDTNIGEWKFGADDYGIDVTFFGATASQQVSWDQSVDSWYFGDDAEGVDVYFRADTTGDYVLWDESDEALEAVGAQVHLDDDSDLQFGTDKDWVFDSDTAKTLDILPLTTDETSVINVGADTAGADFKVFGATTGTYMEFDATDDELEFVLADLKISQGSQIEFVDVTDGANDWTIDNATDETLLIYPTETTDDQSINLGNATNTTDLAIFGATASTVVFDASGDEVIFNAYDISLQDGDFLKFGDGDDFTMDSSTTKILDFAPAAASDDYEVHLGLDQSGVDLKIFGATTGEYWLYDASADSVLANTGNYLYTATDAEVDQFKVDATGTAAGFAIVFKTTNGGIQLDADDGTNGDITIDAAGVLTLTTGSGAVVFSAGQTRKETLGDTQVIVDGANPPAVTSLGTDAQGLLNAWSFDANPDATGDDIVFLMWNVPDGYVADSLRVNVGWSYSDGEANDDDVVFDMEVLAVAQGTAASAGETWDAAGTAFTQGDTNIAVGADSDKLLVTTLNPEVTLIAVDDTVIIEFWVDESECDLAVSGTVDIHFFEMEWESTE